MLVDPDKATEEPQAAADESAAPAADPTPVAAPSPVETPAESGTPAEPKSALEAALMALGSKAEPAEATAAQPAGAVESPESQAPAVEDAQDENLADVPKLAPEVFSTLPKEARTAFNQLRKQVGSMRPVAERGQAITEFLQTSGVTLDEFAELQRVGALMKSDPQKAREALLAHLDRLDEHLGIKLPADLHSEVEQGFMPEDRARELSQARARSAQAEKELQARAEAEAFTRVVSAADAWEQRIRETDPDFDHKLPNIRQAVELEATKRAAAGKPIVDPAEAIEIMQRAYDGVGAMLARFRPKPVALPASPSSAAPVPVAAPTPPKSALDAAWAALRSPGRG